MNNIIRHLFAGIILLRILLAVHCANEVEHPEIEKEINKYVITGDAIDGFFKPNQMLGTGDFGGVWKGKKMFYDNFFKKKKIVLSNFKSILGLLDQNKVNEHDLNKTGTSTTNSNWTPIAMKFVQFSRFKTFYFQKEFRIFTQLLAYKNQTVERYGIPAVWYKGDLLNKFHAIGMSLCDVSMMEKQQEYDGKLHPIDVMVTLYQSVNLLI